jgi:hypothetical protein
MAWRLIKCMGDFIFIIINVCIIALRKKNNDRTRLFFCRKVTNPKHINLMMFWIKLKRVIKEWAYRLHGTDNSRNHLILWRLTFSSNFLFYFPMAQQPLIGQVLLISRFHDHTHLDTPPSAGLLWTSDQPNTETSTRQHTTDRHPCPRWDSNPQSQQPNSRRPTS